MKKLIVSEMVPIILVLGVFLLVFTFLNGWEKTGQERHAVALVAAIAAVGAGAVVVTAAVIAVGAVVAGTTAAVAAVVAAVAASVVAAGVVAVTAAVIAVGAGVALVTAIVVIAAIAAGVVVAAGIITAVAEKSEKINVSKKAIWLSMGVEAAVIILPILLITFC